MFSQLPTERVIYSKPFQNGNHFCSRWVSYLIFKKWSGREDLNLQLCLLPKQVPYQVRRLPDKIGHDAELRPLSSCSQGKRSSNTNFIVIKFMVCDYLILFPNDIVDKSLFLQFIETLHH